MLPEPRRGLALVLAAAAVLAAWPAAADAVPEPALEPIVVVAVVDTGINPYHEDFRDPDRVADPATYVPGFPDGARRLDLTLDAPTLEDALARDAAALDAIEPGVLYWIPGTRIVGAIVAGGADALNAAEDSRRIVDDDGHGTATASLAAGERHGACPRCLLVVVEGFDGGAWAARQPWIDVVSHSYGTLANLGVPAKGWGYANDHTRAGAERGQTHVFAAGNGVENAHLTPELTYLSNTNGPDWVVNVGGFADSATGRREIVGTGKPVDVIGPAWNVVAAAHDGFRTERRFGGTSAAAPVVAGALAEALRLVRDAVDDAGAGQRRDADGRWVLALGAPTASGPLADGRLTRAELWDALQRSAAPTAARGPGLYPPAAPPTGVPWVDAALEGYGAVGLGSGERVAAHLLGAAPLPPREDVAGFMALDAAVRDALWGAWDRDGDGRADPPTSPDVVLP